MVVYYVKWAVVVAVAVVVVVVIVNVVVCYVIVSDTVPTNQHSYKL